LFPDEYYEAALDELVTPGCRWLDVGGGRDVFPSNLGLARRLADRCRRLVAVDPSPNVRENPYAHERHEALIEDYKTDELFDVLSLRMVAEHIGRPDVAVAAMAALIKPGGRMVIYTVNQWAVLSVVARLVPFALHHPLKRVVWRTEERDTFPVVYRMNSRRALARLATTHGFAEEAFRYLDDCRTFHRFRPLSHLELAAWSVLKAVGLRYPESCILGIYRRDTRLSPMCPAEAARPQAPEVVNR
jgi:SAM-dependent methyltransferase